MFNLFDFAKDNKKTEKQKIGRLGEDMAFSWLKKEGFKILARNYWKPWGEIDIIAQKGQTLHFVEVKTVSLNRGDLVSFDRYSPEDNLHPWKLKRLNKTIETYLLEKFEDDDPDWQLDAICIYLERGSEKILKIEYLGEIY